MQRGRKKTLEKRGKARVKRDVKIAKRKRMQDAVHASEEKFRVLLESSMDAVSVTVGTKFVYVNKRCAELLGFSDPSKLIGRDFTEFVAPEDRGMVKTRTLRRERGEPEPPLYEFKIQRRDGNKISVETHATAIEYEGKRAVLSFRRDITERKRLEGALRLSERKFRQFVETAQEGVWSIDAEGKTMYANLKMAELLGYGVEELLGKPLSAFMDDRGVKIAKQNLEQGRQDIKEQCEFEFIKKDGSRLYTSSSISPLTDDKGNSIGALALVSDITKRKQMEKELQRAHAQYRAVVEDQTELICRFAPDGALTFVNQAYCQYFNKKREELVGHHFMPVVPEDHEKTKRLRASIGPNDPTITYDQRVVLPDGEIRWQQWTDRAIFDEQGKPMEFQSVGRDITERKRMEEALKQSEAKLKALHRHTRELAVAKTIEEVEKQTLDVMEFTLGLDVADFCTVEKGHILVRGSRGIQVAPKLWEWPLEGPGVVVKSVETKKTLRVPDTRKESSFVDRRTFSGTEKLQLSELAVPVLADNTVVGVLNVESNELNAFTDEDQELLETLAMHVASALGRLRQVEALGGLVEQRTRELKESEERFRGFVERSFDMIVMLDTEGHINYVSPSVMWITGYTPQEMTQQHFRNYLPKDVIPKEIRAFAEIAKGEVARAVPLRIARKDGSLIHIEVNASPIISDGKITGVQAIVRDVSERFKLTEMRDRFISSVTHELRTPLVSIKGYLDLALTQELGALPKEVESSLEVVKRNTERLLSLTNELLDIQRLESGRFQLNLAPMDLQEVVRHCVEEIRPSISEKQTFQIEVPDGPIPIQGDTVRISQVLMNVLSNAVKYTPEGEIILRVKAMEDAIEVQVSDTGIGIRKEDLPRVFEPFAAIEKPTYIRGTGLGLSVARGLVEAQGGRMWADSQGEGKGANFTFTLAKTRKENVS